MAQLDGRNHGWSSCHPWKLPIHFCRSHHVQTISVFYMVVDSLPKKQLYHIPSYIPALSPILSPCLNAMYFFPNAPGTNSCPGHCPNSRSSWQPYTPSRLVAVESAGETGDAAGCCNPWKKKNIEKVTVTMISNGNSVNSLRFLFFEGCYIN